MPSAAATAELSKTPVPQGHACANCGTPVDEGDRFCNVCRAVQEGAHTRTQQPEAPPAQISVVCKNCGAAIKVPPDQRSITCPFCDSNMVVESLDEQTGRQAPEFVVGFAITPQEALEKFRQWLRANSIFRPGDLSMAKIEEKLRGVYVPFWSFSMLARSQWSAQIGEHWWRTETYTTIIDGKPVVQTRTVQETEWWNLEGQHHNYYSGYLVSGSRGLAQDYAERIKPFRLEAIKRYQPYYLAGWLSEEYSVVRDDALPLCQEEFQRWEQRNVESFLPGDTYKSVLVNCEFSDVNSDLILLPIYLLSYRYGDKLFRFLLNGQTGKTAGDKPYSPARIGAAVAIAIVLVVVVCLLFMWRR
ncbi:MAG TPA: zinc ribbon domain-containing protein [Pirellulales bacterium]|jgi:hypothetical protein